MTDKFRFPHAILAASAALLLLGAALGSCAQVAQVAPGRSGQTAAPPPPREAMVTAADPRAVEAGVSMIRKGGNAVDAAIATMAVLGLVEPQSAGLGGGGFLLHYDAESEAIVGYDGRERAPMAATPELFLQRNGQPLSFPDAVQSGLSIGTPSLVAMLKLAHDEQGALAWAELFEPAIALAENGFEVSPRLAEMIALVGARGRLKADIAARHYLFDAQGNPWPAGHVLRNPTYGRTLRAIAAQGADAMRTGPIADAIVRAARAQPRAGRLSLEDLRAYQPRRLAPICGAYRVYRVCGMPSPSSGGTSVLAILGLYERARPNPVGPANLDDWSAFMWASRLAYVDRDHYAGDDQYIPVPQQEMISGAYLDERARLITLGQAPQGLQPGAPAGEEMRARWGRDATHEAPGTTHISIVDLNGDAVAMTATVESAFGSQRMAAGFMLNNELTDFSLRPAIDGLPVANAPGPGKRPRSSMSPTIITDADGDLVMAVGSPGGSAIIAYVARAIVGVLDWGQTPQQAFDTGNVIARTPPARIESSRLPPGIAAGLSSRGWAMRESEMERSGLHGVLVTPQGLVGGADPRREGIVGRYREGEAQTPAPAPAVGAGSNAQR